MMFYHFPSIAPMYIVISLCLTGEICSYVHICVVTPAPLNSGNPVAILVKALILVLLGPEYSGVY